MSAEMPPIEIHPDHWKIVQRILQEHVPDLEVWALGSRAKWSAKEFSNLDLAIITDEPLPIDTSAALNEAFSESDLPWRVGVVDWTSVGDGLKKAIKRDKILVQEKGESTRSEWKQVSLHEVCQRVTSGGTPSRRNPAYYEAGVWPWVKTQELKDGWIDDTEEHITDAAIAESSAKVLPANTVLLAMYGATVGQLGILRRPMACNQACCAIISDDKKSDFRFLYYCLLNIRSELRSLATGAAQQNLSGALIKSLQLTLPDLFEQRAIARILGTLDDKIELNRKQNETLEAMARAMFKAWFVDFEPVRAKMEGRWKRGQSLPGMPAHLYDLFPDRMVESELGEIPEGWGVGALGDVAVHLNRVVRPSEIERDEPYIGLEHMPKRCISLFEWGKANGLESNKLEFKRGEILFGKLRPYFHKVGVAPIDGVCSTDILTIKPRFPIWFGFVLAHFSSDRFVERVSSGSTGTKMPRTNWAEMARYSVVLPSEGVAASFDGFVRVTGEKIINSVRESMSLSRVRDTLLPRLMSGDLLVRNPEQFLESVRLK